MAKYHKIPYKEEELFFYPNLGAIASFEEITGKSIGEVFSQGGIPKFADIYVLLHEAHKVAAFRRSSNAITLAELKSWVDGEELLKLFSEVVSDMLSELGVTDQKKTK